MNWGCAVVAVCTVFAGPAAAETGSIGNASEQPINYWVGVPGEGGTTWQAHTIGPCEVVEWSWDLPDGQNALPLSWGTWADERKDGYGNMISSSGPLYLSNDPGALVVFTRNGEQIWLDASGAASMEACGGGTDAAAAGVTTDDPDAGSTAEPAGLDAMVPPNADQLEASVQDLFNRVRSGEILLLDLGAGEGTRRLVPLDGDAFATFIWMLVVNDSITFDQGSAMLDRLKAKSVENLDAWAEGAYVLQKQ